MKRFTWSDPPGQTAFPIAKAGYPFIFAAAFATTIFALTGLKIPALAGLVVAACICGFFRDPDRVIPVKENAVVSPADGKVIFAETVESNPFIDEPMLKISIFMTVFNVHVNRIPFSGTIDEIIYNPGKFFSANLDKASMDNEQNALVINTRKGAKICVVQIAGLIARRIICYVKEGDTVNRGERFGLICFGSRLDVYLPEDSILKVPVGTKVRAGTSILAQLNDTAG